MIHFERGRPPKKTMRIGIEAQIEKWLLEGNPNQLEDFEVVGKKVTIKSGTIILKNLKDAPLPDIEFKLEGGELIIFDDIPIEEKLTTMQRLFAKTISDKTIKTFNSALADDDLKDYNKLKDILKQILKENSPKKFSE
jgi:hypothetical protein